MGEVGDLKEKLRKAEVENNTQVARSTNLHEKVQELEAARRAAEIERQELEAARRAAEIESGGIIVRYARLHEQMHTLTTQLHVADVDNDLQELGANWHFADIQSESQHTQESQRWWWPTLASQDQEPTLQEFSVS